MRSDRRRAFRTSLRSRVLAIALVPSLALLSAGVGLSAYLLVSAQEQRDRADLLTRGYQMAVAFMPAMSQERRASILMVADPAPDNRAALTQARREMDGLLARFGAISSEVAGAMPDEAKGSIGVFVGKLPQIIVTREKVDEAQVSRLDVYRSYTEVADAMIVAAGAIGRDSTDTDVALQRTTVADLMRVSDWLDGSNALAVGALAGGGMTQEEIYEYNRLTQGYRAQLEALESRVGEQRDELAQLRSSESWRKLSIVEKALIENGFSEISENSQYEDDVVGFGGPETVSRNSGPPELPVSLREWQDAARDSATKLSSMGLGELGTQAAELEGAKGDSAWIRSLVATLGMLVIIGIVVVIAIRLSNKLVRRLVRLRTETLELADERLPYVVQRLRAGDRVDVAVDVPELDYGQDEIGQVAAAFNKAQQTAVTAAVQEAKAREGINAVFLNIARRSQAIVHRQLQVLDTAERAADDPDQLELLFQLDHSTTRERRNAENLIILGGGQLGRQWRNPVSLVEIVRSAVAEAEQYTRVTTNRIPNVLVDGRAVADLIHLLAELIDNATAFSPPGSRIEVHGNPVGKGVVVEVDDQGLGIEAERREALNEMFRGSPDFGLMALSDDARIGLFVVAQLAHQHGIQVTLMESIYGGVRAGVLIPTELVSAAGPAGSDDRTGSDDRPHGPTGGPPAGQAAPLFTNGSGNHEPTAADAGATENDHQPPGVDSVDIGSGGSVRQPRGADTHTETDRPALPRRRRQEHLARRLQEEAALDAGSVLPEPDFDDAARRARDTLSAFQRGTERGRTGGGQPGS